MLRPEDIAALKVGDSLFQYSPFMGVAVEYKVFELKQDGTIKVGYYINTGVYTPMPTIIPHTYSYWAPTAARAILEHDIA